MEGGSSCPSNATLCQHMTKSAMSHGSSHARHQWKLTQVELLLQILTNGILQVHDVFLSLGADTSLCLSNLVGRAGELVDSLVEHSVEAGSHADILHMGAVLVRLLAHVRDSIEDTTEESLIADHPGATASTITDVMSIATLPHPIDKTYYRVVMSDDSDPR